jgi:hypothetical protein
MSCEERVAQLFLSNPNRWMDWREIAHVGGGAAWRTRLSEARRKRGLTIENKVERHTTDDGQRYTSSAYRLVTE